MNAKYFAFFESYYDAIKEMDDDEIVAFTKSACALAFNGEEPEDVDSWSKQLKIAWALAKPNIVNSVKRVEGGSKGGRPKKKKP